MAVNLAESTLRKVGKEPMLDQLNKGANTVGAVKSSDSGKTQNSFKMRGKSVKATPETLKTSKKAEVRGNALENKKSRTYGSNTSVDKSVYDRDYNLRGYTPVRTGEVRVLDRVDNYEKTGNKTTGHVYHGTSKKSK